MVDTVARVARKLYPIEEGAHALGVGRTTAYALIKNGDIKTVHIGRRQYIPADEIDRFIESLREEAGRD